MKQQDLHPTEAILSRNVGRSEYRNEPAFRKWLFQKAHSKVVDRRRSLAPGQLFGIYVAGYPVGRIVVEKMRTDEAELILGQRLNVWTSIGVFLLGVWIFWWTGRRARRAGSGVDAPEGAGDGPGDTAPAPDDATAPAPDDATEGPPDGSVRSHDSG